MDFDADDERRKRKHHQRYIDLSQSNGSDKAQADEDERTLSNVNAQDLTRLRGRGNGPTRIAAVQALQKSRLSRSVQRLASLNDVAVQRDGNGIAQLDDTANKAKGGIIGSILDGIKGAAGDKAGGGGIVGSVGRAVADALAAYDPMVAQMWEASVIWPLSNSAQKILTASGATKVDVLKELRQEIRSARYVVKDVLHMIDEGGGDPTLVMQLKALNNMIMSVEAGISTHIPENVDLKQVYDAMEIQIGEVKELGTALIEDRQPKNPLDPDQKFADNPMAAKMWQTTVVKPFERAMSTLKGNPEKQEISASLVDLRNSKLAIHNVMMSSKSGQLMHARGDKVIYVLMTLERQLEHKLGHEVSLIDVYLQLELAKVEGTTLKTAVAMAGGNKSSGDKDTK